MHVVRRSRIIHRKELRTQVASACVLQVKIIRGQRRVLRAQLTTAPTMYRARLTRLKRASTRIRIQDRIRRVTNNVGRVITTLVKRCEVLQLRQRAYTRLVLLTSGTRERKYVIIMMTMFHVLARAVRHVLFVSHKGLN